MSIILSSFRARLAAAERDLAIEALRVSHGGIKRASIMCGLHPSVLRRIIERHGLQQHVCRHPARGGNYAWRALGDA